MSTNEPFSVCEGFGGRPVACGSIGHMRSGGRILVVIAALVGLAVSGTGAHAAEDPSCDTGLRFTTNVTSAAMGLRVMSVEVANCGVEPLQLNGYPQVKLFDEQRA